MISNVKLALSRRNNSEYERRIARQWLAALKAKRRLKTASRYCEPVSVTIVLDAYWPVIEAAVELRDHYVGKICPDSVAHIIEAINKAQKALPITRRQQHADY